MAIAVPRCIQQEGGASRLHWKEKLFILERDGYKPLRSTDQTQSKGGGVKQKRVPTQPWLVLGNTSIARGSDAPTVRSVRRLCYFILGLSSATRSGLVLGNTSIA